MRKTVIFLSLLFVFQGCTTLPSLYVSKPWIRSLKSHKVIEPGERITIKVEGTTSPLIGNEQLISEVLQSHLTNLLKRRGFIINNKNYDYSVKLLYRTEKSDKLKLSSMLLSRNVHGLAVSWSGTKSNLGVSVAQTVGALASRTTTISTQTSEQVSYYTHVIAIEISNRSNVVLWKGESTWDARQLNLLDQIIPVLQLILSDLPTDGAVRPEIPAVKRTHAINYFKLQCKGFWFTCPALPYSIQFPKSSTVFYDMKEDINRDITVHSVALAAYVDLIQTAEYALPQGDKNDWDDPVEEFLWEKVTLGGQYYLGPNKLPINIIVELYGQEEGYYISKCKLVNDREYSNFNKRLSAWRESLKNYYDVYLTEQK